MRFEEVANALRLVSGEVVGNDMDFSIAGLMGNDFAKKANKLLAGMTCGSFAENLACCCVEGCIKRQSPVTVVFESMPFGTPRRKRQHGIETIQSLNGRLFVHTEDGCVSRRVHVETNNIGGFGFEIRIVRRPIVFNSVWLQSGAPPDAGNGRFRNTQMLCQFANAPVCRTIRRLAARPSQNASFQLRSAFLSCSSGMSREQTRDTASQKALFPTTDVRCTAGKNFLDLSV